MPESGMPLTLDPANAIAPMSLDSPSDNAMTALYRVALGPVNTEHYLPIFARFDDAGRTTTTWNWPAALFTLSWLVFRQLWGAALVYVAAAEGLALLVFGLGRQFLNWPQPVEWGILAAIALFSCALPGLFANAVLHTEIRKRIARALSASRTVPEAAALLERQASSRQRLSSVVIGHVVVVATALLAYMLFPPGGAAEPARAAASTTSTTSAPSAPATPASNPTSGLAAVSVLRSAASAPPAPPEAVAPPSAAAPASAQAASSAPAGSTAVASAPAPVAAPTAASRRQPASSPAATAPPVPAATATASTPAPKATAPAATASKPAPSAAPAPAAATSAAGTKAKAGSPATPPASKPAAPVAASKAASKASTPAPARPPASAASDPELAMVGSAPGFYINVGLFAEEANARKTQSRLLNEGLPAFRQPLESAKGTRIRVRVGPFDSKAEADTAAQTIQRMGLEAVVFKK